jgi:hypothetical protein
VPITRRRLLGFFAGAAAAIGVPSVWISCMKAYSGPVSDHFDGERFFDRDGMPPKTLGEVLRWQFGERKRFAWPDWVTTSTPIRLRRASRATRCASRSSVTRVG